MFYCDPCGEKNDWPRFGMMSWGNCEMCGELASCWDVPSSSLPMPSDVVKTTGRLSTRDPSGQSVPAVDRFVDALKNPISEQQ